MRFIKPGLIGVLVFFLMVTGISLLLPSYQRVSRAINIAAPAKKLAGTIGDLNTWAQWNRFTAASGLTHVQISSPSTDSGAFLSSDQLELTILHSDPGSIVIHWDQVKGRSFDGGFNIMQLNPDSATVQCWFDLRLRWYPWEKLSSLFYDQQLGPVMEESLSALKLYVKNSP
jgi:hypothetical protein